MPLSPSRKPLFLSFYSTYQEEENPVSFLFEHYISRQILYDQKNRYNCKTEHLSP
jgi:hypothetical protein